MHMIRSMKFLALKGTASLGFLNHAALRGPYVPLQGVPFPDALQSSLSWWSCSHNCTGKVRRKYRLIVKWWLYEVIESWKYCIPSLSWTACLDLWFLPYMLCTYGHGSDCETCTSCRSAATVSWKHGRTDATSWYNAGSSMTVLRIRSSDTFKFRR